MGTVPYLRLLSQHRVSHGHENAVDENTDQDKHVERVLVHDFEVNELEWRTESREVEGWVEVEVECEGGCEGWG